MEGSTSGRWSINRLSEKLEARMPEVLPLPEVLPHKECFISLKIKGKGRLEAELFYSQDPAIKAVFHSCPEADITKPFKTNLLKAYKIPKELDKHTLSEKWAVINILIDDYCLEQGRLIDGCEEVLGALDKTFSANSEYMFLWKKGEISQERIKDIVKGIENKRKEFRFNIAIKIADKRIVIGTEGLVPALRQNIAIKISKSEFVSGNIWITPTPVE